MDTVAPKFQLFRSYVEAQIERRPAVIMITSTHEDDGRGFAARGLAESFKRVGHRTALLDCDSHPEPAKLRFGINGASDISYVRRNVEDADTSTYDAIQSLLQQLRADFTFVVVNAPPLLRHPSVMLLATASDGVLLTVRHGRAALSEDELVVRLLSIAKANLVGVVAVGSDSDAEFDRSAELEPKRIGVRSTPKERVGNAPISRVAHLLSVLRRS